MSFLSAQELAELGLGSFGENVFISRRASFYGASRIHLGSNVRIDDFCILSAGAEGIKIGNYIHIACYSSLIGRGLITLEDFVNISSRVSIFSSNDDYSGNTLTSPMVPEAYKNVTHGPVTLHSHAIVGCGSIILPNVTVGRGCGIGALSLVNRNCEEFAMYVGTPARKIKGRSDKLLKLEQEFLNYGK